MGSRADTGRRAVWRAVLIASLAGWALLLAASRGLVVPAYCFGAGGALANDWGAVTRAAAFNPPGALAVSWAVMLAAMMPPLLAPPLLYIRDRSLKRRRGRSWAFFLAGYGGVWMAAGLVLIAAALALRTGAGGGAVPLLAAAALAALWQASPWKQACLNRCHRLARLSAFGLAADRDALRFGVSHGFWCAGSCGPLMILPLAAPAAHLPLMAAVALFLFAERLEEAGPCRWRVRVPRLGPGLAQFFLQRAIKGTKG